MPLGTEEYRESFVGGGGVFFGLAPNVVKRRWINDLNPGLMSVYEALRDRSVDFINMCREIVPVIKGEEEVSTKGTGKKYNRRLGEIFDKFKYNEGMDQALRYFFINRTVWGGRVNYDPKFESRMYYSNPNGWNITVKPNFLESLCEHIRSTEVTCGDYSELLRGSGESVWCYMDPPYIVDTMFNKGSKLYEYGFDMDQHREFVLNCKKTQHRIAISYDDKPEVREWFKEADGFHIYEHIWKYCGSTNKEKVDGKELVITNYVRPVTVDSYIRTGCADFEAGSIFDSI